MKESINIIKTNGKFYNVYEIDAYIFNYLFKYKVFKKSMLFYIFLYGSSDIYYMIAGFCILDPFKEALPGHLHQLSGFFRNIANHNCPCCVGMIPLIDY